MKRCIVCHHLVWPWQDKGFCRARFDNVLREVQWHRLVHGQTLPDAWWEWIKGADDGMILEMTA